MKTFRKFSNKPSLQRRTLNSKFWNPDQSLKKDVRDIIESRAVDFISKLGIPRGSIEDLRIVGGNASYSWSDSSDIDVTIVLDRNMDLSKEEIRRLGISASNLTYRLSPSIDNHDLNYFIGSRNVSALRPARQAVYSMAKGKFLVGPTTQQEEPNFIAGKANSFAQQIEACISDEDSDGTCAEKLLKRLKRYRLQGLKSKEGEESTNNLVWRTLSRSGYISTLKSKIDELEKSFYRVKSNSILETRDLKLLARDGAGFDTIPQSILMWNKKVLLGDDPTMMISRIRLILALFLVAD